VYKSSKLFFLEIPFVGVFCGAHGHRVKHKEADKLKNYRGERKMKLPPTPGHTRVE
jgi:hypothetical protein